MQYYRQHARQETADLAGLKKLLATYPDNQAGNFKLLKLCGVTAIGIGSNCFAS